MVTIPNYTKGLVLRRETTPLTNFSQIEAAQAPFEAASQIADVGVQIGQKIKETQDMTAVNEAVIRRQKEDIDFRNEFQKSRTDKPLGYAKDIQEQYKARDKAIMESLPSEEARQAYQLSAERLNLQHYENDVSWETKQFATVSVDKAKKSVDDLAVMAYRGVPLDEIKKQRQATTMTLQGVLSPDELKKFDAQAEAGYTEAYIDGLIDTDPFLAKKEIDSRKYDKSLDVDTIKTLTDRADSAVRAAKKEFEEQQTKQRVQDALLNGSPLDPKDNDTKKALDTFYNKSDLQKGLIAGENEAANDLTYFASRTNYIPSAAVSTLRGQLLNGSNQQKSYAIDTIARLQEEAPNSLDAFPKQDLSTAYLANNYIRSGMQSNEAIRLAEEETDPLNENIRNLRNTELNSLKKDYADMVQDNFDPSIFSIGADLPELPAARDSIVSDYKTMYDGYYRTTGSDEVAKELANREFKRVYAVSTVTNSSYFNGGTIMKYAPEAYYAVAGLDNGWMREQLQEDVNANMGKEVALEDIVILSDHITAREKDNLPTYQVYVKDELGQYQELKDENENLLRYRFDSTKAKAKYRQEVQEETESLRRIRERRTKAYTTPAEEREKQIMMQRLGL